MLKSLLQNLKYQSTTATLTFAVLGAPLLLLALTLFPSPMTAMKAQVYWVIIPVGVGGTIISALIECRYRQRLRQRRAKAVVWPVSWFG